MSAIIAKEFCQFAMDMQSKSEALCSCLLLCLLCNQIMLPLNLGPPDQRCRQQALQPSALISASLNFHSILAMVHVIIPAGTLRGHDYTVHWLWCKHNECAFRWKTTKADLETAYANELSEAKGSHQQHVSRIRRQWEKEQKVCCYLLQRMMQSGTTRPPQVLLVKHMPTPTAGSGPGILALHHAELDHTAEPTMHWPVGA